MLKVGIWVVSFGCAGILLLQWQCENVAHRKLLKFCHFQPVHVRAEIIYLQRYSTNFRNPSLSSKRSTLSIWVESFRCAGTLLLQWPGENFAHRQQLKFCHFQPVHCARKIPISLKVFHRFSKSSPQLEHIEGGHLGGSFTWAGIRHLQWPGENFAHRQHLKFCHYQLVHFASKNLYLQGIPLIFEIFASASKMLKVGIWVGSFSCAGILLLQWQGQNFAHRQHLKFCYFQPVQCASKNPISPKIFNQLSKSLPQLEDVEGGHLSGKFQVRRYFTFAMASEICASTTFEVLLLHLYTVPAKFLYL